MLGQRQGPTQSPPFVPYPVAKSRCILSHDPCGLSLLGRSTSSPRYHSHGGAVFSWGGNMVSKTQKLPHDVWRISGMRSRILGQILVSVGAANRMLSERTRQEGFLPWTDQHFSAAKINPHNASRCAGSLSIDHSQEGS